MATDRPAPKPCDQKIFKKGEVLFVTHTIPSNSMEEWVQNVAKDSGQSVDWHFMGGRAVVLAIGDLNKVRNSMRKLMPDHDHRYNTACEYLLTRNIPKMPNRDPPRPDWW